MKILVLDDDDTRHRRFRQWFVGFDVVHAFTIEQFNREYLRGTWNYVFLDHDLNDNQYRSIEKIDGDNIPGYVGPCQRELTGKDAAHMVAESPGNVEHVVVHSWNRSGGDEMMSILRDSDVECTRWEFNPKEDLKLK